MSVGGLVVAPGGRLRDLDWRAVDHLRLHRFVGPDEHALATVERAKPRTAAQGQQCSYCQLSHGAGTLPPARRSGITFDA
jgi:hypothetical protein